MVLLSPNFDSDDIKAKFIWIFNKPMIKYKFNIQTQD
jgi:hypothetical protein